MRTLRLRKTAQDDIEDAFEWYRGQSPTAVIRFLLAVDEALAIIRERPETFPVIVGALRRTLLRRFPYAVYFKIYERTISVVGVVHGHRTRELSFAASPNTALLLSGLC
jgi:plasmid stabilization system protein ParE